VDGEESRVQETKLRALPVQLVNINNTLMGWREYRFGFVLCFVPLILQIVSPVHEPSAARFPVSSESPPIQVPLVFLSPADIYIASWDEY